MTARLTPAQERIKTFNNKAKEEARQILLKLLDDAKEARAEERERSLRNPDSEIMAGYFTETQKEVEKIRLRLEALAVMPEMVDDHYGADYLAGLSLEDLYSIGRDVDPRQFSVGNFDLEAEVHRLFEEKQGKKPAADAAKPAPVTPGTVAPNDDAPWPARSNPPAPSRPSAPRIPDPHHSDKLPKNATDDQILDYIHKNFPSVEAWLGDKEMRQVIFDAANDAARHGGVINGRKLDEALKQTKYWETHGPASRAFDQKLAKGDGSAQEEIRTKSQELNTSLVEQGIHLNATELGDLAKKAIRGAWTDVDTNRWIADRLRGSTKPGATTTTALGLKQAAEKYGVKLTDAAAQEWALGFLDGTKTQDEFGAYVRDMAKANWANDPGMIHAIDSGITPAAYLAPHVRALADTFEIDEQSIDLFGDPKYGQVLRFFDPDTKMQRSMTPTETTKWARAQVRNMPAEKRPTWWKQQDASLGLGLAQFLGAAPQGGLNA